MADSVPPPKGKASAIRDAAAGAPLLEVTDLTVSYGRVQAVRGISFSLAQGKIVSLIGANGAGKTSAIAAIAGLRRPNAGRVHFAGQNITGSGTHDLVRRGLVLVPEGRQILAGMTVVENLELGTYPRRDRGQARRDMEQIYARFPVLAERRHLAAGSLSGGEQQVLAIARGLLARPRLLMMDEPSMGLAPMLVNEVFRILMEIHATGTTLLLVEQNARKALAISDYAYVMQSGSIVLEGSGQELLKHEGVVAAYLGTKPIEPRG